jgi:hypothetical protein
VFAFYFLGAVSPIYGNCITGSDFSPTKITGILRGTLTNGYQLVSVPAAGLSFASTNALYKGSFVRSPTCSSGSGYTISIPVCAIPKDGVSICTSTPAFCNAPAIQPANAFGSRAASDIIFTDFTLPRTDRSASYCFLSRTLADNCVSRDMILSCCEELIPSSKTNRNIVQHASTAMPPITSQNAILWTESGYFGRSKSIPIPTAKLASTLSDSSQKWGQKGNNSPESHLLRYVSITAMLSWLIVSIIAIIQLIKSIASYFGEKRK